MNRMRRMIPMVATAILLLDFVVGPATEKGTLFFETAEAQSSSSVTRGPYLQLGTPHSVVVRWRTSAATDSRVVYGLQPGVLTQTASSAGSTTEHQVALQGLTPGTRYYYAVGTSTQILAGGSGYPFTTSPPAGTARPTRIWVLGDAGTNSSSQRSVRDAYAQFNQGGRTDLWLMLGDNAYSDGTDSQYQEAVFNMYPETLRTSVLWPTLGNHDAHSSDSGTQSGPYYSIFTLPKNGEAGGVASGTEAYYSFDYGNIHFICLDSAGSNRSTSGAMLTWLQADLLATDQTWVIAFWHHPPYSKGSHNSDSESELVQMRQNALPILEQGGVDLVLSGHSHSYERSFLLDRHYGSSSSLTSAMKVDSGDGRVDGTGAYEKRTSGPAPHEGAVYVVAGSSGQTSGGSLNHPAMFVSFNTLGSVALDVNGQQLDAKFIDSGGSVKDRFTMLKGASTPVPRPVGPSELVATAVSSSRVDLAWRDNASNEAGFHVERCAGSGCTSFARVASLSSNVTRFTDGSRGAATTYRYRVMAYNTGGESTSSNISSVTTLSPPPGGYEDFDGDGVDDLSDDCPTVDNASQPDGDGDGIGDACEDPRTNADFVDTGSSAGRIDGSDYFRMAWAFGTRLGDAHYDPIVDVNRDRRIDGGDLALLAMVWAESVPQ